MKKLAVGLFAAVAWLFRPGTPPPPAEPPYWNGHNERPTLLARFRVLARWIRGLSARYTAADGLEWSSVYTVSNGSSRDSRISGPGGNWDDADQQLLDAAADEA